MKIWSKKNAQTKAIQSKKFTFQPKGLFPFPNLLCAKIFQKDCGAGSNSLTSFT